MRTSLALSCLAATWVGCSPVESGPRDDVRHEHPHAGASTTPHAQELTGWTEGEACTPFMLAHFDRAQTVAAALVNNAAFRACVADRMQESYLDCFDDASFPTYAEAATGLLRALERGTHISLTCTNREGGACGVGGACPAGTVCRDGYCSGIQDWAHLGHYMQWQPTSVAISAFWTRENWYGDIARARATNPAYPWDATADTTLHEFAHTQGYDHVYDEACAMRLRSRSYYAYGEPSAPYILSECASAAVQAVYRDGGNLWSCAPGEVRLPASYRSDLNDPRPPPDGVSLVGSFSGSQCVRTLRYRAALWASGGQYVQAYNRGGSTVSVVSPGPGDWETFYVVDRTRGTLVHGNPVNLRTPSGHFLRAVPGTGEVRADGTSDSDRYAQFYLYRALGSGTVQPNETVFLYNLGMGRYVTAVGGGGAGLRATASTVGTHEYFTLELPSRGQALSLETSTGSRVAYTQDSTRLLSTRTASSPGSPAAREEMFWVVDHNGGALAHNDLVSFEWSKAATFVATCYSGTGSVRGDGFWANRCARFFIQRLAGPGRVVEGDQVRLISAEQGNYLTAAWGRISNSATTPTSPGVFRVRFSQSDAF